MNRYYFNFCEGQLVFEDHVGMYLPNIEAAKEEAKRTLLDVVALKRSERSSCAVQIADADHQVVFTVQFCAGKISIE